MERRDLDDRIFTLLMLYESNKRPLPRIGTDEQRRAMEENWAKGLLHNVTEMDTVKELKGTPAEALLRDSIEDARKGDPAKLEHVCERLRKVLEFLRQPAAKA